MTERMNKQPVDQLHWHTGSSLSLGWWLEEALARVRWLAVPTCLLTILIFPGLSPFTLFLPAIGFGLGNIPVAILLRQQPTPARLQTIRVISITVDWSSTAASIYAFSTEPMAATPAILLLLLATAALRFQLTGLAIGSAVALAIVGGLATIQSTVYQSFSTQDATVFASSWAVVIGVVALVLGGLMRAFQQWMTHESNNRDIIMDSLLRFRLGLSPREWDILAFLLHTDLTYEAIGHHLNISSGTVKTHVRNIGEKLNARGRQAVIAEATKLGFKPPRPDLPSGHA